MHLLKIHRLFIILLLVLQTITSTVCADSLPLDCSNYSGLVVLNELNTKAKPDYVELYFLSPVDVLTDSWYIWVDTDRQLAVPAGSYAAGDFLLLSGLALNPSNHEVMLVSSSASSLVSGSEVVIDYLGYGGASNFKPSWDVPETCGTVYMDHRANAEVIDRLPDGTGGWADHADYATPGTSNDGSEPSCGLSTFAVQAPSYALACPTTRAIVSLSALCSDGSIKSDYAGTVSLSLDRASAAVYTSSSGGSPVSQIVFDGTEGGVRNLYVYDGDEHVTTLVVTDGAAFGSDSIDFRAYGFLLSAIPGIPACDTHNANLTAFGQDENGAGCDLIEGFSGGKPLKAWFDYLQPTDNNSATQLVVVDSAGNQLLPALEPTADNLNLDFVNGVAQFGLAYRDAGQLQVHFRYDQPPYDGSEFGPMVASSNAFIVVPFGFGLRAFTLPDDVDLNNGTDSGNPKWAAGVDFRLQIQAQCADGGLLTNYQPTDAQMWVEVLLPSSMYAGDLSLKGVEYSAMDVEPVTWSDVSGLFSGGMIADSGHDSMAARYSEVGVIRLHLRDNNYLGEVISEQNLTVGRFTPASLQVSANDHGQMQPACNGYTYTGESMSYATPPSLLITARNAQGATTRNYSGNFMKLTEAAGAAILFNGPLSDGTQLGQDGSTTTDLTSQLFANLTQIQDHGNGNLTYTLSVLDSFTYTRNTNALIAPYISDIDLQLVSVTDGDGISDDGTPFSLSPTGVGIRFGRLVVDDAYGPQTDDLIVRVRAESFDGSSFVDNTDDYCTLITPSGATMLSNWQDNLASGETAVIASSGLLAGSGEIVLSAPGIGVGSDTNDGSVDLTLDLSLTSPSQNWLLNDEDADGVFSENPLGTASFGMYRGDDRFLYWREAP